MLATLLFVCATPFQAPPVDPMQPLGVLPSGDVHGVFVTEDETRAYVGEGSQITVLDLSQRSPNSAGCCTPTVMAKVPIDATVMALTRHDTATERGLFVAGGRSGLWKVDVTEPVGGWTAGCASCPSSPAPVTCLPVTQVDDTAYGASGAAGPNHKWCWDVAIAQVPSASGSSVSTYVVALFTAQHDQSKSELRIYRRSTMGLIARVELDDAWAGGPLCPQSPGFVPQIAHARGFSLATRRYPFGTGYRYGSEVYVAMGTAGVAKVDLTKLALGPAQMLSGNGPYDPANSCAFVGTPTVPTLDVCPEHPCVRDVAVTESGEVYAAASEVGVLRIDPITLKAVSMHELRPGTAYAFASRVETVTDSSARTWLLAAGTKVYPDAVEAPYEVWGRFGWELSTAGNSSTSCPGTPPLADGMFLFQVGAGGPTLVAQDNARHPDDLVLRTTTCPSGSGTGCTSTTPPGCSTGSGDCLSIYEQPYGLGQENNATCSGGGAVVGLRHVVHCVNSATLASNFDFVYTGSGNAMLDVLRPSTDPDRLVMFAEGSSGADFLTPWIDFTDPACPQNGSAPISVADVGGAFAPGASWNDNPTQPLLATKEYFITARDGRFIDDSGWWFTKYERGIGGVPVITQWPMSSPTYPAEPNTKCYHAANYHRSFLYRDALASPGQKERVLLTHLSSGSGQPGNFIYPNAIGGVVFVRRNLQVLAEATPAGQPLFPDPLYVNGTPCQADPQNPAVKTFEFALETHPELADHPTERHPVPSTAFRMAFNGEVEVRNMSYATAVDHAIAVVAAGDWSNDRMYSGLNVVTDPDYGRPLLVTIDLSTPTLELVSPCACAGATSACPNCPPTPSLSIARPLGRALGPPPTAVSGADERGMLIALRTVEAYGKVLVFACDTRGRVMSFDITDPRSPQLREVWQSPLDQLDGDVDACFDVDVDFHGEAAETSELYLTVLRVGVVRLKLQHDPTGLVPLHLPSQAGGPSWSAAGVERFDSTGLAHTLHLYSNPSGLGIVLSDKQGGLRVFGNWP